jgi:hypothetical protein
MTGVAESMPLSALNNGAGVRKVGGNDFQVTNRSDFFEFRIGTAKTFTMSQNYAWWNPDSSASVRQDSGIQSGEALVEIRDADGVVVHLKNLREQGFECGELRGHRPA